MTMQTAIKPTAMSSFVNIGDYRASSRKSAPNSRSRRHRGSNRILFLLCSEQTMPLAVGTRLGAYEITDLLGAGGMGEVYRAHDTRLQREVAIKVLSAQLAATPEA